MPQTITPADVKKRLQQAGFDGPSIAKLMGVNPELALVAARAKELYEASHPGNSFQIDQGFRSKYQQQVIAAKGSNYTNASGKKGHESPHQFGQAFDFHLYNNGVRQPNNREDDSQYVDVAGSMRQAAQELGYADKLNYGAFGDVHVGHGKSRHPDWGHIEEKRSLWNQWHPGQQIQGKGGAREGAGQPRKTNCIPCVQPKEDKPAPSLLDFIKPKPFQIFKF